MGGFIFKRRTQTSQHLISAPDQPAKKQKTQAPASPVTHTPSAIPAPAVQPQSTPTQVLLAVWSLCCWFLQHIHNSSTPQACFVAVNKQDHLFAGSPSLDSSEHIATCHLTPAMCIVPLSPRLQC